MDNVSKKEILQKLLSILYKHRQEYISGQSLAEFGITLKFLDDGKLDIMLFSNSTDIVLYNYRKSIFNSLQQGVLKDKTVINQTLTDDEDKLKYLFIHMGKYLRKEKFIDTRGIWFDYVKMDITTDIYSIISNEPGVYTL